jgi:predicted nucleic acid-binding protein
MAQIFLDSNFVIETIGLRKTERESQNLKGHYVYVSPLTVHIVCYVFKINIPSQIITDFVNQIHIIDMTQKLVDLALSGPTKDLEDNIQLHSAAEAECDYFLTNDKNLLKIKFFGKTKIVNGI